jgi:hypothetical protein
MVMLNSGMMRAVIPRFSGTKAALQAAIIAQMGPVREDTPKSAPC